MDQRVLEALNKSIEKWEQNAEVKSARDGKISPSDCALCVLFYSGDDNCAGCPVREKTGRQYCQGTPYTIANRARVDYDDEGFREASRREVAFLKKLRPKEKKT